MPMRGVWTIGPGAAADPQLDAAGADGHAVELGADRERLAQAARSAAEIEGRLAPAPLAHRLEARGRLERADEHGLPDPSCAPQTMLSIQWMP